MTKVLNRDLAKLSDNVPENYVFRCRDGNVLRNMRDLRDALLSMTDKTFAYHSNSEKSDFSNWVKDIIKDSKLAADLAKSVSRLQAAKRTADRMVFLGDKLANLKGISLHPARK